MSPGFQQQTPLALLLVGCLALLHVLGLIDDRRPLGPWLKLAVMAIPAFTVRWLIRYSRPSPTRACSHSWTPTSGAVAVHHHHGAVAPGGYERHELHGQHGWPGRGSGHGGRFALSWPGTLMAPSPSGFVGACLSLLVGACLGFLFFNWPRRGGASIFMGDSGSLVLGFLLAFLTVRTTYYSGPMAAASSTGTPS